MRRSLLAAAFGLACVAAAPASDVPASKPPNAPAEVGMSAEAQRGAKLQTVKVERRRIAERVQAPGAIVFDERHVARVRPFAQGRVVRLLVQPGDTVAPGQPLAELDTPGLNDARDSLAGAQASLRQAQAEVAVAEAAQRRGDILAKDGSIARAEAERRRADTARARAAQDTARAQVGTFESRVARLAPQAGSAPGIATLASPIGGVVVSVGVTSGEVIDSATEAFVVADLSLMLVIAQVSEKDVSAVADNSPAEVRLTAGPERSWEGRVVAIGAELDPKSRTLPVRIELSNADRALRAGMFAQVSISGGQGRNLPAAPAAAIQTIDDKPVAFVRVAEDRFERRDLVLGIRRGDWVEVRSGLREGEDVVTNGSFALKAVLQRELLGSGG